LFLSSLFIIRADGPKSNNGRTARSGQGAEPQRKFLRLEHFSFGNSGTP
jgi:hypothetical protein